MIYILIESLGFFLFYSIILGLTIDFIKHIAAERDITNIMKGIPIVIISIGIGIIAPIIFSTMKYGSGLSIINFIIAVAVGISMTKFVWKLYETVCGDKLNTITQVRSFQQKYANVTLIRNYYDKRSLDNISKIHELIKTSGVSACLETFSSNEINAGADTEKKIIQINTSVLSLPWEEIAALVGHELMHIKLLHTDRQSKKRFFKGNLILISIMAGSFWGMAVFEKYLGLWGVIPALICGIILLLSLIYYMIYCNINKERYWYQIYELMCDRKACEIAGVTSQGMYNLLKRLDRECPTLNELKWYSRYYIKYYVILAHPCLKYRANQIKNYKKWSIIDYFKHPLIIMLWLLTGRGWIGE